MNIFQIQQEKLIVESQLEDLLLQSEGVVTKEIEELLESLEFTKENFLEKIDSTIGFIKEQESKVSLIDSEISRLKKIKDAKNNTINRNKLNLVEAMQNFDMPKIDRNLYKLSLRRSNPAPIITGEIPEEFLITEETIKVDNAAVKDFLLKNGEQNWGIPQTKYSLIIN